MFATTVGPGVVRWRTSGSPPQIGVQLTEGFMMEPEGSVSALVFHHPEARYFSLTPDDTETLERRVRAAEGA